MRFLQIGLQQEEKASRSFRQIFEETSTEDSEPCFSEFSELLQFLGFAALLKNPRIPRKLGSLSMHFFTFRVFRAFSFSRICYIPADIREFLES